jgi:hypothetical protein
MPYPASVDSGPVQSWFLGELADLSNCSANTRTVNGVYFQHTTFREYAILTGFRYQFGTGGNGHCDIGLYDAGGTLLTHIGSTLTATGVQTYTLASVLPLAPGRYYLAFWIDNATDTSFSVSATNLGAIPAFTGVNAGGLPALMSSVTLNTFQRRLSILGLIQGGWS